MSILSVKVDKRSQRKYRLRGEEIEFDELRRRIIAAEGREFLQAANRAAAQAGLSNMTGKEINGEIRAARNGSHRR